MSATDTNQCPIPKDHRFAQIAWLDTTLAVVCFVTATASMFLNLYVLYVLVKQWKNRTVFLFLNMAITDLMSGLCAYHLGHVLWHNGYMDIGEVSCGVQALLFNILSLVTPQLISYICVMRFLGVSYPTVYKSKTTKKVLVCATCFTWMYAALLVPLQLLSKGTSVSWNQTRFCDFVLDGSSPLHDVIYTSSAFINIFSFLFVLVFTVILTWNLRIKVKASRQRNKAAANRLESRPETAISLRVEVKRTLTERKLQQATLLAILFAVNFNVCYLYNLLYYGLPAFIFENIAEAVGWLTSCDATASLYFRFWYYYSASLSSLINALIHLVVNDIVRKHILAINTFTKEGIGEVRRLSAILINNNTLSPVVKKVSSQSNHLEIIAESDM